MASNDVSSKPAKSDRSRRTSRRTASPAELGVGGALRSVYDDAKDEAIPQEMLDLLGRLD